MYHSSTSDDEKMMMMVMVVTIEVAIVRTKVYQIHTVYFKYRIVSSYTRFKHNVTDCCTIRCLGQLCIRVFLIRHNI